jgi:hypothetical protein
VLTHASTAVQKLLTFDEVIDISTFAAPVIIPFASTVN